MYKRGKLNDIFENYIVFRELNPVKKTLPQFEDIKRALHIKELPRKKDYIYAEALGFIFKSIRPIDKVFYIGDTLLSDGSVIRNFNKTHYFIAYGVITREGEGNGLEAKEHFVVNSHWDNLMDAVKFAEKVRFSIDQNTVFVVDIDKTAIGARGRNDSAINKARADAIIQIAEDVFKGIDKERFFRVYNRLNTKKFFHITADNQDIVSIITMLVYGGALSFDDFSEKTDTLSALKMGIDKSNGALRNLVFSVYENLKNGNPTAFPEFRKLEFEKTIQRMDFLPDETPINTLLSEEILITGEVFNAALYAKEKGALLFGVSDKPALSTMPSSANLPPIYEKEMKIFEKHKI